MAAVSSSPSAFSWSSMPPVGFNPNLEYDNEVNQDAAANPSAYWGSLTPVPAKDPKQRAIADAQQRAMNAAAGALASDEKAAGIDMTHHAVSPTRVIGSSITPVGAGAINPHTGLPVGGMPGAWSAQGGSEASMHRAQVAAGIRPAIDARTSYAPGNYPSGASAEIVAGFGSGPGQAGHSAWPVTPTGTAGSALWSQMTQKFNSDNAARAARLAAAQSNLSNAISDNPTPSTPMGGDSDDETA